MRAADAPGGGGGVCWLTIVGGTRETVAVEEGVAKADCCICCMYGVREIDGAMYSGVWLLVMVDNVISPAIREWLVVVFTDVVAGVGKPNYGV